MPVLNRISNWLPDIIGWRHDFHAHPELMYDVHRTAARVAELLRSFDLDEVATGIGQTGVVGVIRGNRPGPTIALRADMDALPMQEATGLPHASSVAGKMHACGHDGHTAMLLGAARYLAETRDFAGSVVVIFQPAEEGGAGGLAMADDGLFDRWPIEQVHAMHNLPGFAEGQFLTRPGALLASADTFDIHLSAKGGHAAWPHTTADPIVAAGQIIGALQTIVSRGTSPLASAVVSVTKVEAGSAYNVIPGTATISGTLRSLDRTLRDQLERRLDEIATGVGGALGCDVVTKVDRICGVVVNDPVCTTLAARAAAKVVGASMVNTEMEPLMGGDDFAFMSERRPGSYVFVGNGNSSGLHTVTYDFNDAIIPTGISYWVALAQS